MDRVLTGYQGTTAQKAGFTCESMLVSNSGNRIVAKIKNSFGGYSIDIFDFELDGADLASMAMLDQGEPFYARTPEKLAMYATWCPDVEGQK